jgi:hypothetical protein
MQLILKGAVACFLSLGISAAFAQTTSYSSAVVVQSESKRLNVHASGNKVTCKGTDAPTIKLIKPPQNGTLTVKRGEVTTDKFGECGRVKLPAQIILYQSRGDFTGTEHVVYLVRGPNGEEEIFDFSIEVKAGQKPLKGPPSEKI